MPLYSYELLNQRRDLSDILSTVIKDEPRFISNFRRVADAKQRKHEWLEDQIGGRSVTAVSVSGSTVNVSEGDAAKLKVGTVLTVKNDSALFRVGAISGTTVTLSLVAANGSTTTFPAAGNTLNIVSTPMKEGTGNGDGEENYHQNGTAYNTTQIVRKDVVLTRTAMSVDVYGNIDNQVNRQTAFALGELARDLNRVALFGRRVEGNASTLGEAGGLYLFGTQTGGLSIDAAGNRIDSYLINDAAQAIMGEGGEPLQILCSPGQARAISNESKDRLQILREDRERGAYVAVIVNEINGRGMTIIADPDVPETDVWVLDPAGFGLANLKGGAITDADATDKGFDGIKRVAIGELTFEFKNAKQRLCRISNVQNSAQTINEYRNGIPRPVTVAGGSVTRSIVVHSDSDVPAASTDNFGYTVRIGTAWTGGSKIATAALDEVYASNGTAWIKQA